MLTRLDYYQFCNAKRYFTHGSNEQYERAFCVIEKLYFLRDYPREVRSIIGQLATITWICSDPDLGKSIEDIEKELYRLYNR